MADDDWVDAGSIDAFERQPLSEISIGRTKIAVSKKDGVFGAVSGVCNHAGGPLGQGTLDSDYIVCPWHGWKFHRVTGEGEPGFEEDRVPRHEVRVENGHLWVRTEPSSTRHKKKHDRHALARPVQREPGPTRVAGISTTAMDDGHPRPSTSEVLLGVSLEHADKALGCETRLIRLNELQFRHCEGYYSKSAQACTWPCSITQMDSNDQMDRVYEVLVHWADVVLVSTPIRWGVASSLYFKMAERLNCVQNQITIRDKVLIANKVTGFIITGGQDNIQSVAGQMLTFFSELGFCFPQFPYVAHSRGWSAEDMERNIKYVMKSESLREGARGLVQRAVEMSQMLLAHHPATDRTTRGGRKAHHLDVVG